jgi:hypothetical protein
VFRKKSFCDQPSNETAAVYLGLREFLLSLLGCLDKWAVGVVEDRINLWCNFFILTLFLNNFYKCTLVKHFLYLDSVKCVSFTGALGGLQGTAQASALEVHVDSCLPQWIIGCQ